MQLRWQNRCYMTENLRLPQENESYPLCIDLDGTLFKSDLTQEALAIWVRECLFSLKTFMLILSLTKGRAAFKKYLQSQVELDLPGLPLEKAVVKTIEEAKKVGRKVYLVTGQDESVAKKVCAFLPLFDDYFASNGEINLVDKKKAAFLDERFGFKKYDYVGNSSQDYVVWQHSRESYTVHSRGPTLKYATPLEKRFKS